MEENNIEVQVENTEVENTEIENAEVKNTEEVIVKKPKRKDTAALIVILILALLVVLLIGLSIYLLVNREKTSKEERQTLAATEATAGSEAALTVDNVDEVIAKMASYTGLTVSVPKEEVTEDDIDYYTDYFFSMESMPVEDRGAIEGDTVYMDYVGTIDGEAFEGGTAEDAELVLGSHSYIDGFEEGLIGAMAGEERVINLKFPDNYGVDELDGKDCVFTVTVKEIYPAISDEAVAALGSEDYSNVEEYRASVRRDLEEYYEEDYNNSVFYALIDQIVGATEFNVFPSAVLNEQKENVAENYTEYAEYYGMDLDGYLEAMGSSLDEIAESYARQSAVFLKISKDQNFYPTLDEIYDYFREEAEMYGYDSVEDLISDVGEDLAAQEIMVERVTEYILANNTAINE